MLARTCVQTARYKLQSAVFALYFLHKGKWSDSSFSEEGKTNAQVRSVVLFLRIRHCGCVQLPTTRWWANEKFAHPIRGLFWCTKPYWMTPCSTLWKHNSIYSRPKEKTFSRWFQSLRTRFAIVSVGTVWKEKRKDNNKIFAWVAPLHFGVFFSHGLWGGSHSRKTPFCNCDNGTSTTANQKRALHQMSPKIKISMVTAAMIDSKKKITTRYGGK